MISRLAKKLLDADEELADAQLKVREAMNHHMRGLELLRASIIERDLLQAKLLNLINEAIKEKQI